jgi:hypothetical protein
MRWLFLFSLLFAYSPSTFAQEESLKQGSWLSATFNRNTLWKYTWKIQRREITLEEFKDYIRKGGDIYRRKNYDVMKNFSVGEYNGPVISFFTGRPGPERLECIKILLALDKNGIVLQDRIRAAIDHDDVEAAELLFAKGAKPILPPDNTAGGAPSPSEFKNARSVTMAQLIIKNGVPLKGNENNEGALIYSAIKNGNFELLQWALNQEPSSPEKIKLAVRALAGAKEEHARELKTMQEQLEIQKQKLEYSPDVKVAIPFPTDQRPEHLAPAIATIEIAILEKHKQDLYVDPDRIGVSLDIIFQEMSQEIKEDWRKKANKLNQLEKMIPYLESYGLR